MCDLNKIKLIWPEQFLILLDKSTDTHFDAGIPMKINWF